MAFSNAQWKVAGESVTGTGHQHTGRGCDDAHGFHLYGNDLLLLAVADGAGSASHSATGATVAVRTALDTAALLLKEQPEPAQPDQWLSVLTLILRSTHEALSRLVAEHSGYPEQIPDNSFVSDTQTSKTLLIRDFATTLLIAIISHNWLAVAQIGDGAVVIQQMDADLMSLSSRSEGEYLNETEFVTDSDYLTAATYRVLPREHLQGIALLTDGLQMMAMNMPDNTPHAPFFTPLFRIVSDTDTPEKLLRTFLASERVCAFTDDDKTLLMAVYT